MENPEVDVEETNVETTENQEIDYKSLYEEKEAKVSELEGLIQKHKWKKKTPEVTNNVDVDALITQKLAEKDFYSSNPEMSEYKDQINEFTSKGLSHEQAKRLVIDSDPTIQNRANAQNSNFTEWTSGGGVKSYSQEDLYKLGQKNPVLKRQAMEDIASGKAIETA